jgi:hypothetical protein
VFLGRWNHIEVAAKEFFTGKESRHSMVDNEEGEMRAHVRGPCGGEGVRT